MIISASRRTDIPAFYSEWFINRIRAGYCTVPNPFNRKQVSYVSLEPDDVEVIVFWTRNAKPLMPYLDELDELGFKYYFQYTVLDYPKLIDNKTPPLASSIKTVKELSKRIGHERIIWRYDPIVFSEETGGSFHLSKYEEIAKALKGHTFRSVVSIVDFYSKISKRLKDLKEQGIEIVNYQSRTSTHFDSLMSSLVHVAKQNGMEIFSCAEIIDLSSYGISPGKCVDDVLIGKIFGIDTSHNKDAAQRKECGCVESKDVGMYDTCLFGCQYCYASRSFERAKINFEKHDPKSPSLIGWYEAKPDSTPTQQRLL